MLSGLNIRNMLLIDALDLEFQSGLNVLTGETGAGKSILLDSLVCLRTCFDVIVNHAFNCYQNLHRFSALWDWWNENCLFWYL